MYDTLKALKSVLTNTSHV